MDLKNWKTSVGGIVVALPQILPVLGVAIPPPVGQLITAIGAIWFAYFAKDKDVTGIN